MSSRSVNKALLLGHLGHDAEVQFTPNGTAVVTFSVATGRRWRDKQSNEWKEETSWHRCVLWRGENVAPYLTKGQQVHVEGRMQTRKYQDRNGSSRYVTEVIVDELILCGSAGRRAPALDDAAEPPPPEPNGSAANGLGVSDDDVPF